MWVSRGPSSYESQLSLHNPGCAHNGRGVRVPRRTVCLMRILNPRWLLPLTVLVSCSRSDSGETADSPVSQSPIDAFWASLGALCGNAYGGRVTESVPADTAMSGAALVMHVRDCSADTIRIPFHVGENRSRTWVLTRTANGIRLKHDHRHEDGVPDSVTMYGGDTRGDGAADAQEFFADSLTATLIPAARTNMWTLELHPQRSFVYALRREGSDRRFRAEFDLTTPVPTPPPAWGNSR